MRGSTSARPGIRTRRVLGVPLLLLSASLLLLPVLAAPPAEAQHSDGEGDITMAMVGDLIITRALMPYREPEFLRLRDLIGGATVGFGNMEMLLHEYGPDIIPSAQSGGTYMAGHPDLARDLAWMGLDMLGLANNHTMDWGAGGMRSTQRALAAAGIKVAGSGDNLALARAPAYLETMDGRVALIAVSSSFSEHMRAGHQRPDLRGRPGLAPMRFETTYVVPGDVYESLDEARAQVGGIEGNFEPGDGYRTITTPHEGDLQELLATVRDARRQANWVVVTSHTHQGGGNNFIPSRAGDQPGCLGLYQDECNEGSYVPADALVTFARATIDAGADAFYAHGPHVLRGIEIYQEKPIFYSLDDFLFQNETPPFQPWDNYARYDVDAFRGLPSDFYDGREQASGGGRPAGDYWWDGVVAVSDYRDGELYEIRLVPTVLGFGLPRPQRGRPVAASGEDAQRILTLLAALSDPFGTEIEVVGDEGVIRGPGALRTDGSGRR